MTLLAFIVAIVILVVFHELGHYWVARLCNVKVLRFSLGFGKVIYSKRFASGETEWVVSMIPLGGYVKMLDEREGEVLTEELPRAFNRQSVLKRMAIVVAGPVANLLLAIVFYWALFIYGVPGVKPILGAVPQQTAAASAQLRAQETIISINGQATPSWQEVRWMLLDLVLQHSEASLELKTAEGVSVFRVLEMNGLSASDLDGDFLKKLGLQPYQPPISPVIDKLIEGGAAQRAGLQANDKILRVNDQAIAVWDDFVEVVRGNPSVALKLEVERAGRGLALTVTPDVVNDADKKIGRIGAAPKINRADYEALLTEVHYPPLVALSEATKKTWETSVVSLKMMWKMVLGEVSLKNLSGPITIADYAGQSAQIGFGAYISFLALISISLGVLNLLPIPLLDGGHLLYYAVELLKGSPVSDRLWEVGQNVGIALLVTMMAFALYNDISRLILG
ncbi:MAG: RIP metalloprotease RseP [Gallionellaceae bacterium]|nr:RIP metalloprotease RseP [Gallionellaceae bacterium]